MTDSPSSPPARPDAGSAGAGPAADAPIVPAVLCGGVGTRLWPLSRRSFPKPFLPLTGAATMLQETVARVAGPGFAAPILLCNDEHRFLAAEQMRAAGIAPGEIVLEPEARGTAPAAAVAALLAAARDPAALVLMLPADHAIADTDAFAEAVATARAAAATGRLVTFGMTPDAPETGYGYIKRGAPLDLGPAAAAPDAAFAVARFVEKPARAAAEAMLAEGGYDWNSGMFLFPAATLLAEMERLAPAMLAACRAALDAAARDLDFLRLDAGAFAAAPEGSIDVTVMERTERAAVVPARLGWSDIGEWAALWRRTAAHDADTVAVGDVVAEDTTGSYLRSEGPMVAALGLENMVVVATPDAVLAAPRERAGEVRRLVERMARDGRPEQAGHLKTHRPWGWYQSVDAGAGFQVKRLCLKPGARLSLQRHRHRAEHWVVVAGTARVTCDDAVFDLAVNESTFVPAGAVHRLENPGAAPLHLIEVQSGDYLGEDDIERVADDYRRD